MRRTLPFMLALTMIGAACGGSDSAATGDTSPEAAQFDTDGSIVAGSDDTVARSDDTVADVPVDASAPSSTSPDKPTDIDVPGEAGDELVVTVLEDGEGPTSELGDTVIVDYVGVRSVDGEEFDNSYDRGTPFLVGPLGSAPVIQGWNDGLVGVQAGAQLQLDIPSAQAYGAEARSEIIRENEPLTFVIDVRSVIKVADPADAPSETGVESSEGATELSFEDLVEGDGDVLEEGQTAVFHLVLFRADNGVQLDSTWETEPIQVPIEPNGFPALVQGMPGMNVGGRRAITAPPELSFGPDGSPEIGLPAGTDVVIVVDLLGVY